MGAACIFCGVERKLSKEHLWPDWLGKMYLRRGNEKHTFGSQAHMDKALIRDGVFERPGHLFTLKIRSVCCRCNNGWMSQVENEMKPLLLKMISGNSFLLTPEELHKLSFWVALKVVVAEFAEKKESLCVTPERERKKMMDERKMPNYFHIFLGVHSINHNAAWLRHSWTMAYSRNGPTPPLEGRNRNAQSISFVIGPIFFYVLNIRLLGFDPHRHFKFGELKRIWPSKIRCMKWPQKPLKKIETDIIGFMSQDFSQSAEITHIPEMPQ